MARICRRQFCATRCAIFAENVWLLEKTQAQHNFVVFGNDIEVPKRWLVRYGYLRGDVAFYFLTDNGQVVEFNSRVQ